MVSQDGPLIPSLGGPDVLGCHWRLKGTLVGICGNVMASMAGGVIHGTDFTH